MTAMALNVDLHLGDYDSIVTGVPTLLAEVVDRRTRDQLEITLSLALVDLGRHEAAYERLTVALEQCADDHLGTGNLLWVLGEAHLWAGDPAAGLVVAQAALERTPPDGRNLFPLVTLAHCLVALGKPVVAADWPAPHLRLLDAAPLELAGLVACSAGDREQASAQFSGAAQNWAGHHRRGELRCRWLAADTAGDTAAAQRDLLGLEGELAQLGWAPLLGQVRRSLRARGVRSAAPRGRAGELTAREREVLDPVAAGLSTDVVAARLGLAPSTVAAQIASARARLGATGRWQAASGG